MTQDEIISMAHEAEIYVVRPDEFQNLCIKDLERFAKLVAAHEREACAMLVEKNANRCGVDTIAWMLLSSNAEAIRARGQQ